MERERTDIPKLQGYHCFACGTENPIGLNLHFYRSGDAVCSDITLKKEHAGWENMAHGGIISTLLDEVMSWTVIYFKRVFFVTRRMEVKYIKPIIIGTPLTITGHLKEESNSPRIDAMAEIIDNQGNLFAKGTGEFIVISKDKLSLVPEGLKEDMESLFDGLSPL